MTMMNGARVSIVPPLRMASARYPCAATSYAIGEYAPNRDLDAAPHSGGRRIMRTCPAAPLSSRSAARGGGSCEPDRSLAADGTSWNLDRFRPGGEADVLTEHTVAGHWGGGRGAADRCVRAGAQRSADRNDPAECEQWTEGAEDGAQRRAVQPVRSLADRRQSRAIHLGQRLRHAAAYDQGRRQRRAGPRVQVGIERRRADLDVHASRRHQVLGRLTAQGK